MADYKRMVSYMYQYEKGIKKKNVGYARIEARNGQCKFTLRMQMPGQPDSIFPTYLIHRDDSNTELIYLGDSVLKNNVIDSKHTADEKDINNSGYGLSDIGGMVLFLNTDEFFATEWDDKPIIAKEIMAALKPKPSNEAKKQVKEEGNVENNKPEETPKSEEMVKKEEPPEIIEAAKMEEPPITEAVAKNEEAPKVVEAVKKEEPTTAGVLTAAEEAKIPKYKLPRGWKTVERLQNNPYANKKMINLPKIDTEKAVITNTEEKISSEEKLVQESKLAKEDNIPQESKTAQDKELEQKQLQQKQEMVKDIVKDKESEESQEKSNVQATMNRAMKKPNMIPDSPIAARFFKSFPRINPFEDNEITQCVKIEPKDIGLLPKELWGLSNNSFLLHGYYSYRHLIFAKMMDRYGARYIIGVPGTYHSKEKFIARMFGFDCFKPAKKRELRQGDFGYWYVAISI